MEKMQEQVNKLTKQRNVLQIHTLSNVRCFTYQKNFEHEYDKFVQLSSSYDQSKLQRKDEKLDTFKSTVQYIKNYPLF